MNFIIKFNLIWLGYCDTIYLIKTIYHRAINFIIILNSNKVVSTTYDGYFLTAENKIVKLKTHLQ